MNTSIYWIFSFLFCSLICHGQDPSEAYYISTSSTGGKYNIDNIELISSFNKGGYNNQPFYVGSELYLACSRGSFIRNNTDLVKLDLQKRQLKYLTNTGEQEFSPSVFNGKIFFVKLDKKNQHQELWSLERGQIKRVIQYSNIAYYQIIDQENIALVLLEDNQLNLYLYNTLNESKKLISRDVGRSIHLQDSDHLMFVHKYSNEYWHLKKYSIRSGRVAIVQKTIQESEDFCIGDNDIIWMGKGSKIFSLNLNTPTPEWQMAMDLEKFNLTNIKRLATNNNNQFVVINQ
ncbi:hypothetical protein [Membranihabitans maritimus]|uniref:hypothetical protein n=1 Tax=Membranihabitans maritimus TaxID=2904244 RepID=UPI001F171FE3|nr:hypothetical protein [Membranihabitans maritimus]